MVLIDIIKLLHHSTYQLENDKLETDKEPGNIVD